MEVKHPKKGSYTTYAPFARYSDTPLSVHKHAPMLGEDNDYVYRHILALSEHDIEELTAEDDPARQ